MRTVLAVLVVGSVASVASASNFTVTGGTQGGMQLPAANVAVDGVTLGPIGTLSIPSPGAAVFAVAGLATLARRQRRN